MTQQDLDSLQAFTRCQLRISLDSDMGELFKWLLSLRPGSRTREVGNLIRIGFAFRNHGALPPDTRAEELPAVVPGLPFSSTGKAATPSTAEAMAHDISAVVDWNLSEMCRPPSISRH